MSVVGRHAAPDDDETPTGTDDFAILRTDSDVRTRCLIAGFVPIALYTLALVALQEVRLWATLLVFPLGLSGVLIGAFLDAAHRRRSP